VPTSDFYEFGAQLRAFMSGGDSGRAITDRSSWAGLGQSYRRYVAFRPLPPTGGHAVRGSAWRDR
jgi:hypothetical protein